MSNRERTRAVLLPFATTFAGVGGIAFHAGHGPEHLFCIALAAGMAVVGAVWSLYNRFRRPRDNFIPVTYHPRSQIPDGDPRPRTRTQTTPPDKR